MIETLSIERFKSIKSLAIPCRKVNVFIGAPDTGKTNILEALGFPCGLGWGWSLGASLRLRSELGFDPLFYRQFFASRPSARRAPSATGDGESSDRRRTGPPTRDWRPFIRILPCELWWLLANPRLGLDPVLFLYDCPGLAVQQRLSSRYADGHSSRRAQFALHRPSQRTSL